MADYDALFPNMKVPELATEVFKGKGYLNFCKR